MNTKRLPFELAEDLLRRSRAKVQMAAVIYDRHGIFSWGWNNSGPEGLGEHAEMMAVRRANRRRLEGATIVVVGRSRGRWVLSKPCLNCQNVLDCWNMNVRYRRKQWWWEGNDS